MEQLMEPTNLTPIVCLPLMHYLLIQKLADASPLFDASHPDRATVYIYNKFLMTYSQIFCDFFCHGMMLNGRNGFIF